MNMRNILKKNIIVKDDNNKNALLIYKDNSYVIEKSIERIPIETSILEDLCYSLNRYNHHPITASRIQLQYGYFVISRFYNMLVDKITIKYRKHNAEYEVNVRVDVIKAAIDFVNNKLKKH